VKLSQANEYLQTLAIIGAIVGLMVLGYEFRQSNELATQQTKSQFWTNWVELSTGMLGTDIHSVLAKAVRDPGSLTLPEQMKMDDYFWSHLSGYSHGILSMEYTSSTTKARMLSVLEAAAPIVFAGSYGRAWFEVNKSGLEAPIVDAIRRGFEASSPDEALDYYKHIMAKAMASG